VLNVYFKVAGRKIFYKKQEVQPYVSEVNGTYNQSCKLGWVYTAENFEKRFGPNSDSKCGAH